MEMECGAPMRGSRLDATKAFLQSMELEYDTGAEYTVNFLEQDRIVASGSLQDNVLKCIAVSDHCQGEGLAARLVTELKMEGVRRGRSHLFLYTKPEQRRRFGSLGFYPVAQTDHVLLMEDERDGIARFVSAIPKTRAKPVGAMVVNCNPFTMGHLRLIESAAKECGYIYILVVSEEKSTFSSGDRLRLVREGTMHLSNLCVHPTGDYLISSATFPTYFIKEKKQAAAFNSELDLQVFAEHFAHPLGITRRYIGSEPFCPVTRRYHQQMKEYLPARGIEVIERPRFVVDSQAVSASRVRLLFSQGRMAELRPLVPDCTFRFLQGGGGQ